MQVKKVLIIDDEELILMTTKLLLQKLGMEVVCTTDFTQGMSVATEQHPDLILLDLMIPDTDGWEILRILKSNRTTRSIPVILFTAGEFVATQADLASWDVIGLLRKPFNLKELLAIINSINQESPNA